MALASKAQAYLVPPELFSSPHLLLNYDRWMKASAEFNSPGSPTAVFRDLVHIAYDTDIGRPWGPALFPEMNNRFQAFKKLFCPAINNEMLCQKIGTVNKGIDLLHIKIALSDEKVLLELQKILKLSIVAIQFQGPAKDLNLWASPLMSWGVGSLLFWNEDAVRFPVLIYEDLLLTDLESYAAGFRQDSHPGFVSHSKEGLQLNDTLLKSQAMEFADRWKRGAEAFQKSPSEVGLSANTVIYSTEFLYQRLYVEKQPQMELLYQKQLKELELAVIEAPDIQPHLVRYQNLRREGNYPLEIYQHFAHAGLEELVLVQNAYLWKLQKQGTQPPVFGLPEGWKLFSRQLMESLLSLQKGASETLFLLIELSTQSDPVANHAAVLHQLSNPQMVRALLYEMLNVILEMGPYKNSNHFAKYQDLLSMDDVFEESYIKNQRPEMIPLFETEGSWVKISNRDLADKKKIIKTFLWPSEGKVQPIALFRLGRSLLAQIKEAELKDLAMTIRKSRGLIGEEVIDGVGPSNAPLPTRIPGLPL